MLAKDNLQGLLNNMARAYSTGNAANCAAMFAEDAQLHSPFAPPAVGRAAIQALHEDWVAEPSDKDFAILDWGSSDTLAWCLCRFSEGDVTGDGTSLIVLERTTSDAWLIRSCCLFGDPEEA